MTLSRALDRLLEAVRRLGDLPLREAFLDRLDHAAEAVDGVEVLPGAALHVERQPLDEVRAAERIDDAGDAALVGDHLLRPQRQRRRLLGRQRQRLVERVGVQRVGAAEHRRQRLQGGADDVVVRLLRRQRDAGGLGVEAQLPGALVSRLKRSRITSAQSLRAARNLAISSKKSLCELKKNEMRGAKSSTSSPRVDAVLHVLDAVAQRERQLLQRRRAGFADVIAADRDRVPARHFLRRRTRTRR